MDIKFTGQKSVAINERDFATDLDKDGDLEVGEI